MRNYILGHFNNPENKIDLSCPMRRTIVCQDGFVIQLQAVSHLGATAYFAGGILPNGKVFVVVPSDATYQVEYISEAEELLIPYAENPKEPTNTVYGYVSAEVINQIIEKHWGILAGVDPE